MKMKRLAACLMAFVLAVGLAPTAAIASSSSNENAVVGEARSVGNDSRSDATSIDVNRSYSSYIINTADDDYFRFQLTEPGKVSLTFGTDFVDSRRGWRFELIDAEGTSFAYWFLYEESIGDQTTQEFGLPAGTYYVVVKSRDSHDAAHSDAQYHFQVNYEQRRDWETEWNQDRGTADEIQIGSLYYASLPRSSDDDYYSFVLSSPASVTIDFGSNFVDTSAGWKVTLRKEDNTILDTWRIRQDNIGDFKTDALQLPSGKYYVVVEPRDSHDAAWSSGTYHFRVNAPGNEPLAYGFSDVSATDWYATDNVLGYATSHGLLQGYGGTTLFGPYDAVTRGQVATILWRIAGEPSANAQDFSDVNYSEYYGSAIDWARSTGVISGYGDTNTFGPNNPVTRQELCVMLANYAERIAHRSTSTTGAALDRIAGSNEVASWAREQMGWAVDEGIISGEMVNGTAWVNPNGTAQRCAVAKMASVFHRDVLNLG